MNFSAPVPQRQEALSAQQDERRAHILDAARTCFSRAGFHRTSMQEICAEAKMSPGGIYRYFASKDAIIEAIAQEEQCAGRRILEVMLEPGSLHDRLLRCGLTLPYNGRDHLDQRMSVGQPKDVRWHHMLLDGDVGRLLITRDGEEFAIHDGDVPGAGPVR